MKVRTALGVGAATTALLTALLVVSGTGSPRLRPSDGLIAPTTTSPAVALPTRQTLPMLVLYDTSGEYATLGQADAILSANLLGHFGPVTRMPVSEYTSGTMARYAGVVYEGTTFDEPLPPAFLDDVADGITPVVWAGLNIWQFADRLVAGAYGFTTDLLEGRPMTKVVYDGVEFDRRHSEESNDIVPIVVTDPAVASSLGTIVAEDGTEFVWGVEARNLTYVGDSPYAYMVEGDLYLAWTDVLLRVFAPDAPERHRALVRLEDVGPASDPKLLRESIDVLVERAIPFSMAVYPVFVDPSGRHGTVYGTDDAPALRLDERPDVVEVILYALDHGGTIVSHGLTHQYENESNPYDGVSGNDFEFYAAHVDEATDDVILDGPVADDSVAWATERLRDARALLAKAGIPLGAVTMFEPAHYAASESTYAAVTDVYAGLNEAAPPTRFDRGMYFPRTPAGDVDIDSAFGQFYPYAVRDVYGHLVVPENLGNVIEVGYNNNAARTPADIVESARRSLVVRDGVVGFFFHPYLDADLLAETVDGITGAGYEFVSSTSVTTGWDMSTATDDFVPGGSDTANSGP